MPGSTRTRTASIRTITSPLLRERAPVTCSAPASTAAIAHASLRCGRRRGSTSTRGPGLLGRESGGSGSACTRVESTAREWRQRVRPAAGEGLPLPRSLRRRPYQNVHLHAPVRAQTAKRGPFWSIAARAEMDARWTKEATSKEACALRALATASPGLCLFWSGISPASSASPTSQSAASPAPPACSRSSSSASARASWWRRAASILCCAPELPSTDAAPLRPPSLPRSSMH